MPRVDPTVTLGNLLTILTILGSAFGFFLGYHDRLIIVEKAQAHAIEIRELNKFHETQFQLYVKQ